MRAKSSKEAYAADTKEAATEPTATCTSVEDSPKKTQKKIKQVFHYYFNRKYQYKYPASSYQRSAVSGISAASGASSTVHRLVTTKGRSKRDLVIKNPSCKFSTTALSAAAQPGSGSDSGDKKGVGNLVTAFYEDPSTQLTKRSSEYNPQATVQHSRPPKRSKRSGAPRQLIPDVGNKGAERADINTARETAQWYTRTPQARNCRVKVEKQSSRSQLSDAASSSHNVHSGSGQSIKDVFSEGNTTLKNEVLETSCRPSCPEGPHEKNPFLATSEGNKEELKTTRNSYPELALRNSQRIVRTRSSTPGVAACEENYEEAVTPNSSNTGRVTGDLIKTIQSSPNFSQCSPGSTASPDFSNQAAIESEWAALLAGDETSFSDDTSNDSTEFDLTVSPEITSKYVQWEPIPQAAKEENLEVITMTTPLDAYDQPDNTIEATRVHFDYATSTKLTVNAKNATAELRSHDRPMNSEQSSKAQTTEAFRCPSRCSGFEQGQRTSSTMKMARLGQEGESWCTEFAKENLIAQVTSHSDDPDDAASVLYRDRKTFIPDTRNVQVSTVFPVFRPESCTKGDAIKHEEASGETAILGDVGLTEANAGQQDPAAVVLNQPLDSIEAPNDNARSACDFPTDVGDTNEGQLESKLGSSDPIAPRLSLFRNFDVKSPHRRNSGFDSTRRPKRCEDTRTQSPHAKHLIGVKRRRPRFRLYCRPKVDLSSSAAQGREASTVPETRGFSTQTDALRTQSRQSVFTQTTFDAAPSLFVYPVHQQPVVIPPYALLNFALILMVIAHGFGAWLFRGMFLH